MFEYEMSHYYVQDVLSQSFPEFDILTDYDVDHNVIKVLIMDSGTKESIKRFKFDHSLARYDPYAVIDDVTQWCYDYLNPKPEEKPVAKISEKIIKLHKCECCGAPLPKEETKCAYCGAEYY